MRTPLRLIALIVLVLLGAPLIMHVVMHDLHHDDHEGEAGHADGNAEHSDHEHPIVTSGPHQVPSHCAEVTASLNFATAPVVSRVRLLTDERNTVALGAVRIDEDTGLQSLLSTFLI